MPWEKMALIDLLNAGVATILQFVNSAVSAKPNKSRVPVVCNALNLGSRGHCKQIIRKKISQVKGRLKNPTE